MAVISRYPKKWPYLDNGLTNRHEILYSYTYWPSKLLKFDMADGRHLEKSKMTIFRQWFERAARNLARWRMLTFARDRPIKF